MPTIKEVNEKKRSSIDTEKSLAEKTKDLTVFYYRTLHELTGMYCDVVEENTRLKAENENIKRKYNTLKEQVGLTEIISPDRIPKNE